MSETISVLLNNYNYGSYVCDSVRSVLRQTHVVDELIVVDDGSTDDSLSRLQSAFADDPQVRIVAKSNGGQLSAFNAGFDACRGDTVFFLDADDLHEPGYVQGVMDVFHRRPDVDFVASSFRTFGAIESVNHNGRSGGCAGYSVLRAYYAGAWIGTVTSGLAIRRSLLERLLPYAEEARWRTCADDCLVIGSSLAGAKKYFLTIPAVAYRVHGGNRFWGVRPTGDASYGLLHARIKLLSDLAPFRRDAAGQAALLVHEARSIETLCWEDWWQLLRVWRRIEDDPQAMRRGFFSLLKIALMKIFGRMRRVTDQA